MEFAEEDVRRYFCSTNELFTFLDSQRRSSSNIINRHNFSKNFKSQLIKSLPFYRVSAEEVKSNYSCFQKFKRRVMRTFEETPLEIRFGELKYFLDHSRSSGFSNLEIRQAFYLEAENISFKGSVRRYVIFKNNKAYSQNQLVDEKEKKLISLDGLAFRDN